jgi:hypothetical protein
MKKALTAVFLFAISASVFAACPMSAPYRCVLWGGKQICGCGV